MRRSGDKLRLLPPPLRGRVGRGVAANSEFAADCTHWTQRAPAKWRVVELGTFGARHTPLPVPPPQGVQTGMIGNTLNRNDW
jgi:hypothetical protein